MAASEAPLGSEQKRIELLTLVLGAGGSLVVGLYWGWFRAGGFLAGAAVSWLNFRWLKQVVRAVGRAATAQARAEKVRIPRSIYAKLLGRQVLLLGALCAIVFVPWLPGGAVLGGLFTVVAVVLADAIYRFFRGWRQDRGQFS